MNFEKTFPLLFYLNLAKQERQRYRSEDLFEQNDLRVHRFPAVNPGGYRKLSEDNRRRAAENLTVRLAIRKARKLRVSSLFIFSGDVCLGTNWRQEIETVRLPSNWGLFYLGGCHHERPVFVSQNLVRASRINGAFAWGIESRQFDKVLKILRSRRTEESSLDGVDAVLASLQHEIPTYAAWPNQAWPDYSISESSAPLSPQYFEDGWQIKFEENVRHLLREKLEAYSASPSVPKVETRLLSNQDLKMAQPMVIASCETPNSNLVDCSRGGVRKIAFLFLLRDRHNHPEVWSNYWRDSVDVSVYTHLATQSNLRTGWEQSNRIPDWIESKWGDVSLVKIQIALLRAALEDPSNQFFIFCSESCIPIKPLKKLREELNQDCRSRFEYFSWHQMHHIEPGKAARALRAPVIPFSQWVFHSQWILLNRSAASVLIENDCTVLFSNVFAADECYPGTILKSLGYSLSENVTNLNITWTSWEGGDHPLTYEKVITPLVQQLLTSRAFFARKFSGRCDITRIATELQLY